MDKNVFHPNILAEITKFLNWRELSRLMRSCKDLLYKIGKSSVWKISQTSKEFRSLLPILFHNPLVKNKLISREYYDIYYYHNQYSHIHERYVRLSDLLKCSKADLEEFYQIIMYHNTREGQTPKSEINTEEFGKFVIYHTNSYNLSKAKKKINILANNLKNFKKKFSCVPKNVIDLILIEENLDISNIIVNIDNKNHPLKIISRIGYKIIQNEKHLILPGDNGYYHEKTSEAGDEYDLYTGGATEGSYLANMSNLEPDHYGNITNQVSKMNFNYISDFFYIKYYFKLLGKRLDIDSALLSLNVQFILETFHSLS